MRKIVNSHGRETIATIRIFIMSFKLPMKRNKYEQPLNRLPSRWVWVGVFVIYFLTVHPFLLQINIV
jgi:hypothetical protein